MVGGFEDFDRNVWIVFGGKDWLWLAGDFPAIALLFEEDAIISNGLSIVVATADFYEAILIVDGFGCRERIF